MEYMPIVWLAVVIVAVIAEASSCALVSIWFIPAAVISMILSFFSVPLWIQIVVFIACAALLLIFSRTVFKKTLKLKPVATNADAVIGEEAIVIEPIDNIAGHGQVKVRGQIWTARAADHNVKYEKGDILLVVAIEGVKLICRK